MKTYCSVFDHWLFHPVETSLICENRARKLNFSECCKCLGIENPRTKQSSGKELIRKLIPLDVDEEKWIKALRELQEEYDIREDGKKDEMSARRIAILLGELYLSRFGGGCFNAPIVEKDGYDMALEFRLACDPLEREARVKPEIRKKVLCTWGVDKVSGMEGYTTQLKAWSIRAFLEAPEIKEEEDNGAIEQQESGSSDTGSGTSKEFRLEEAGIG